MHYNCVTNVFFSAAIGVGLYGNDDVHNGLVQFITATQSMDDIITSVKNQVRQKKKKNQSLLNLFLKICNESYSYDQ